jgi:hypothetical protein
MTSCAWREQLQAPGGRRIPLPGANETDGFAAPGMNFSGPGWRGEFRMRPTTLFDFVSKIHDLTFVLNDVSIEFSVGTRAQPSLSLKAKADAMFRIMTDFSRGIERGSDPAAFIYRNIAGTFFDGDDRGVFRSGDGFRNPLLEPETLAFLGDPNSSLTIPYSFLPEGQRPTRQVRRSTGRGQTYMATVEEYMTAVPMDQQPGFWAWFRETYAPVLGQVLEISSQLGTAAC